MRKIFLEIWGMIKDVARYLTYIVFVFLSVRLIFISWATKEPLLLAYTAFVVILELILSYVSYKNKNEQQYQKQYNKILSVVWLPWLFVTVVLSYIYKDLIKFVLYCLIYRHPPEM